MQKVKIYIAGCGGMLGEAFYEIFRKDFDLKCTDVDVNDKNYASKLTNKYNSNVNYNITKFSSISIKVLDRNPKMAAIPKNIFCS